MAFAAALIGYKKWVADESRVGCSDTWTDPGDGAVIKLIVPRCYAYQEKFDAASNEVIALLMCLGFVAYAVRTLFRREKTQDWLHWIALGLGLAGALYIPLRWAARAQVEGNWRPTPFLMEVPPPGWTAENYYDNIKRAMNWTETEIAESNARAAEQAKAFDRMSSKFGAAVVAYIIMFIVMGSGMV
jgi:hypothetical protein